MSDSPLSVVDAKDLDQIDFRETALPLGLRQARSEDEGHIVALDVTDWAVLYKLLTTKLPIGETGDSIRAVDESASLQKVAKYARSVLKFAAKTGHASRPQYVKPWEE